MLNTIDSITNSHAMSSNQRTPAQPHFSDLSQAEMSVAQSIKQQPDGRWACELCNIRSNNIMRVITHLLTSCDRERGCTFSTRSSILICMALGEPGSAEMLERYNRVARELASELANTEVSGLDNDSDSEVFDSGNLNHEQDDELVNENVEINKPVEKRPRAPKNQQFPVTPPASLSADKKAEWTFRRARAREIRHIKRTHLQPSGNIDRIAALAAWNSNAHPSGWKPNAANAPPYASYGAFGNREGLDKGRLRDLTAEAEEAEEAQKQQ